MPELPEVQTTAHGLDTHIRGLTIAHVWTDYNSPFHTGKDSIKDPAYFRYFKKEIIGAKVVRVTRRAKNILIHISKKNKNESTNRKIILVHMKMTGHLLYDNYDRTDPFNRFIHLIITFSNEKTLELCDMRTFAKVTLISEISGNDKNLNSELEQSLHLANIGPEPLEKSFTFVVFKARLALRPNGRIKTVLMDQAVIAGIGNIYSDEALWRAGLHPEERVNTIFTYDKKNSRSEDALLKKLYAAIGEVLKKGIDFGGDSMSDYRNINGKPGKFQGQHRAYRKTGTKCSTPGCTGIIIRKIVGGRSAHFCSVHQRLLKNRQQKD
jgi:formamidopyrimidine-DNA glycosylase